MMNEDQQNEFLDVLNAVERAKRRSGDPYLTLSWLSEIKIGRFYPGTERFDTIHIAKDGQDAIAFLNEYRGPQSGDVQIDASPLGALQEIEAGMIAALCSWKAWALAILLGGIFFGYFHGR